MGNLLYSHLTHISLQRIDVAPYHVPDLQIDETPSVLAVSWGKGDPHKDVINVVFLDDGGRLREHAKIDNFVDQDTKDEFTDLLRRRKPDVIVVGGFTMATTKLAQRVKEQLSPPPPPEGDPFGVSNTVNKNEDIMHIPVIYVFDEVARIYQHSKRAMEEFSALSPVAKYCVGLARYTQSPLNEYAALGSDISTFNFNHGIQPMVCFHFDSLMSSWLIVMSNHNRCHLRSYSHTWNEF